MQRTATLLACLVVVVGAVGCQDPYQGPAPADRPRAHADRGDSRGDDRPPPVREADPARLPGIRRARSPRSATRAFCAQWANWTWRDLRLQQRRLAALATGDLAAHLAAQGRSGAGADTLARDRIAVRGKVVAVDVKPGGSRRRAICVTWEEQLEGGRGDPLGARHHVYLATIAQTATGWAIARWEPQP